MQPLWFIKIRAQYRIFPAHYPDLRSAQAAVRSLTGAVLVEKPLRPSSRPSKPGVMKRILLISFWLTAITLHGSEKVGRYRLLHSEITVVGESAVFTTKSLYRIDTMTGRTWIFMPDSEKGLGASTWYEIAVEPLADAIPGSRFRRGDVLQEIDRLRSTIKLSNENPDGITLAKDKKLSRQETAALRAECLQRISDLLEVIRKLDGTNPPPVIPMFPPPAQSPPKKSKK